MTQQRDTGMVCVPLLQKEGLNMKYIIPLMILFCLGLYLAGTLVRYYNTADIERHRVKEQTFLAIEEERARQEYWLAAAPIVSTSLLLLGFCGLVAAGVGAWQRHRVSLHRVWPRQGVVPIPADDTQYTAIAIAMAHAWHQTERTRRLSAGYDMTTPPLAGLSLPEEPRRDWRSLADLPLLILYGGMGSGKTTLARGIAAQGNETVVINPKREDWGVPTVTTDITDDDALDFSAIRATLVALRAEVARRLRDGGGNPLTVIVDDCPVVAAGARDALAQLMALVATIGRSLGFRLILSTQTDRVDHLGSKGMGDITADAPRVHCKQPRYTLIHGDEEWELGTAGLLDAANRPNGICAWTVPCSPSLVDAEAEQPHEHNGTCPIVPEDAPGGLQDADIVSLVHDWGLSRTTVANDYLKGKKATRWDRVKSALGE